MSSKSAPPCPECSKPASGNFCQHCGAKLGGRYCNECGAHLRPRPVTEENRLRFHADIAHPINAETRKRMEASILEAYRGELERSKQPGYKPQAFPDLDYDEPPADVAHP